MVVVAVVVVVVVMFTVKEGDIGQLVIACARGERFRL